MTRIGLNTAAKPMIEEKEPTTKRWSTFRVLSTVFMAHFLLIETLLSALVMAQIHARNNGIIDAVPVWAYSLLAIRAVCRSILIVYIFVVSFRTRSHVREKYDIPEDERCHQRGCEDILVSTVCAPCSVAQLARHTADYDSYNAACCTPTGLSEFAPPV